MRDKVQAGQNRKRRFLSAATATQPNGASDSFTASEAKNKFGSLLEQAIAGNRVVITRHNQPKAVLMSIDEFNELLNAPQTKINNLNAEFDAMLQRMQQPGARDAMQAAFRASPEELGKAAVEAARKRG